MILVVNLLIGKMCLYFCKTLKTYLCYNLPQFQSEMTSVSKRPTTFIHVHTNYDYRGRLLLANVVITHFESVCETCEKQCHHIDIFPVSLGCL